MRDAVANGSLEALPEIVAAIRASGALDYCRQRALEYAGAAMGALEVLPESPWLKALRVIADYAVARDH